MSLIRRDSARITSPCTIRNDITSMPDIESGTVHSGSIWANTEVRPRFREKRNPLPSVGFPGLAKQIAQDPDQETFVFRKFNRLTAWSLVCQENELASLEDELGNLEHELFSDPNAVESATMWTHFEQKARDSSTPERRIMDLTHKISAKLTQYRKSHPCAWRPYTEKDQMMPSLQQARLPT